MAKDPPAGERRHFARIAMESPAVLRAAATDYPVTVLDLCFKGALVQTTADKPLPECETYELHLTLAPGADIIMECEPVHWRGRKLGLHCLNVDLDSVSHLRRLVELNLGDPELLNRELKELASGNN